MDWTQDRAPTIQQPAPPAFFGEFNKPAQKKKGWAEAFFDPGGGGTVGGWGLVRDCLRFGRSVLGYR